ncbi:MAG: response regulator [Caldilineaceae bacterium]|nr:response regulator [Caldilineaceae bacterium]
MKISWPSAKILVVDDTIEDLQLLAQRLRRASYAVTEAATGEGALALLTQVEPHLILLDVRLPDMDGFEICTRIKAIPAFQTTPVIFLTSLAATPDKVHGFAVGGVDFITKPPAFPEVLARIDTHLSLYYLRNELREQNQRLEEAVQQRTAALNGELLRRRQSEEEKDRLFEVVRQQSDQLRGLTNLLIKTYQTQQSDLRQTFDTTIADSYTLLGAQLALIQQLAVDLQGHPAGRLVQEHTQTATTILTQLSEQFQAVANSYQKPTITTLAALENPLLKLTAREREVLQLISNGKSNQEIAELLYLSEATVRSYRSRLMQKLQLNDVSELIKFAIKHHLTALS